MAKKIQTGISIHQYRLMVKDELDIAWHCGTCKADRVLGLISPEEAGRTLCHEHLSMTFVVAAYVQHHDPKLMKEKNDPLHMGNMWWIRQHPYSNIANLNLNEEGKAVMEEMQFFKENGGGTICDVTTVGIQRDISFLKEVSQKTGVHVVAGSGYYVESSRPDTVKLSVEEMAAVMTKELTEGCDGTDIKCGSIGEVGCSWPLAETEKRAVQASGIVNESLKCPVIFHPGRYKSSAAECVRIYQEAGGRADNLIMSHLDRTFCEVEDLLEFAKLGCYCEFDLFGTEVSHYQLCVDADMPSDAQRIQRIKALVDDGYEDWITISHDIHTKHKLMKYGGHGFSHILRNVLPKMVDRGISQTAVDKMVIQNPHKWLSYTQ